MQRNASHSAAARRPSHRRVHIPAALAANLRKHPPFSADEEHAVACAVWLAREEAWSIVLGDPRVTARAVAVLQAADIADAGADGKNAAQHRKLLDALSTGDPAAVARADTDDRVLSVCVPALGSTSLFTRALACQRRVRAAVQKMEVHNLALILHMIGARYTDVVSDGGPFEASDLLAWGVVGLHTACLRFDPRRGFRFSTYASGWIRHAIGRALADHRNRIRIPVHLGDLLRQVSKARAALRQAGVDSPTDAQLAERAGTTIRCLQTALKAASLNCGPSLQDASGGREPGDEMEFGDTLHDETAFGEECYIDADLDARRRAAALAVLPTLEEVDQIIIEARSGMLSGSEQAETLADIGRAVGLSRERVRQREAEAVRVIRRRAGAAALA